MTRIRAEAGPAASMVAVLREFRSLLDAADAFLLVEEGATGRLFLWKASPRSGGDRAVSCVRELESTERDVYLFKGPSRARAWSVRRSGSPSGGPAGIDADGKSTAERAEWPELFATRHPAAAALCVLDAAVEGFRGRLFAVNPSVACTAPVLCELQSLARQAGPALQNLFLLHRLRSRIGENERARLAHELHDGLVQSLIAIELKLDVARRTVEAMPAKAATQVAAIQELLRGQVLGVRELMQQLRPRQVESRQLLSSLAEATERFRLDTGIHAQFRASGSGAQLPPGACRELSHILDEALMNVRKHSGAHNVAVRLGAVNGDWTLAIEDDGKGFDFAGRMTQVDLDTAGAGPMVIKERVRALGGLLAIDSRPGRGARLEITIPQHRYC